MKHKWMRCPAILAAVLILAQACVFFTAAEKCYVPGDCNGDGSVALTDAAQLMRWCAGWNETIDMFNADVNLDGAVNLKDVILIERQIAGGWGVELGEATLTFVVTDGSFTEGNGFDATDTSKKIVPGKAFSAQDAAGKSWPKDPKKSGCTFKGWFTAPTGGTQISSSTVVTFKGDKTVYAQFGGSWEMPEIGF